MQLLHRAIVPKKGVGDRLHGVQLTEETISIFMAQSSNSSENVPCEWEEARTLEATEKSRYRKICYRKIMVKKDWKTTLHLFHTQATEVDNLSVFLYRDLSVAE